MSSFSSNQQEASLAPSNPAPTANRKRGLPCNPDPDVEVIAVSPKTLMATNRFMCEICSKGFQRDQNLQLHRRGHNLPWKLKQRTSNEVRKKVYVCPEVSCVHHHPSRALGDLTGIKKHFSRKHGEKKWKCDKCSKKYAVQSDWKAHSKICGTREYRCDCGTLFSRRDSFVIHRAFCDALAEESARAAIAVPKPVGDHHHHHQLLFSLPTSTATTTHELSTLDPNTINVRSHFPEIMRSTDQASRSSITSSLDGIPEYFSMKEGYQHINMKREIISPWSANQTSLDSIYPSLQLPDYLNPPFHGSSSVLPAQLSATALLQKAAQMGATADAIGSTMAAHTDQSSTAATEVSAFGIGINSQNSMSSLVIPNSSQFQDMMTIVPQDAGLGHGSLEAMNSNAVGIFQRRSHERSEERIRGFSDNNSDGLTRDFLGIRPFFHKDILNMAGLNSCVNTYEQTRQNGEPWQG